jgi:hypothetical protein
MRAGGQVANQERRWRGRGAEQIGDARTDRERVARAAIPRWRRPATMLDGLRLSASNHMVNVAADAWLRVSL